MDAVEEHQAKKKGGKADANPEDGNNKQGEYFWAQSLHDEFMRHFSVYGKTWKVVSAKMDENGIKNKNQLQCRTHGQKYLIGLQEIVDSIEDTTSKKGKGGHPMDKKIYQKL